MWYIDWRCYNNHYYVHHWFPSPFPILWPIPLTAACVDGLLWLAGPRATRSQSLIGHSLLIDKTLIIIINVTATHLPGWKADGTEAQDHDDNAWRRQHRASPSPPWRRCYSRGCPSVDVEERRGTEGWAGGLSRRSQSQTSQKENYQMLFFFFFMVFW